MSELQEPGGAQRILVVDDDPDILTLVEYTLEEAGFEVSTAESAARAREWLSRHGLPHLAVVDIMMPGEDGIQFCRSVHRYADVPVIMLTGVDDEGTMVDTIENVAEDYIVKPFQPRVLAVRVRRVLRRMGDFAYATPPVTELGPELTIDFVGQSATVAGREVSLTPTETKLLHVLLKSANRTVSSEYLLRRIWPLDEVFEDTLRVHIHRLRQKIEPDPANPRFLLTKRGTGYSFARD